MQNKKIKIIGEIGVNHNGSLKNAKKIVDAIKNKDLDYIKIQTYITDNLVVKGAKLAKYQKKNLNKSIDQYELLKKYELSFSDIIKLKKYIEKSNKFFLSSVFDIESLKFLYEIGCRIIKIPSGEMNNFQLLDLAAKMNLSLIISTGMSGFNEIKNVHQFLSSKKISNNKISFLHCVSDYPPKIKDLNIRFIEKLKIDFPKNKIGYSDHTTNPYSSMLAISQGAKIIEKHITLNKNLQGPDHKSSLNINDLSKFIQLIRQAELMLGNFNKKINFAEKQNSFIVKKSIYANTEIKKGQIINSKNIILKRPVIGLTADNWFKIIGRKSKKNLKLNDPITINDIS